VGGANRESSSVPAPTRLTLLIVLAAVLSAGALFGVASTVGVHRELVRLVRPHWLWLGVAVVGEFLAYFGYIAGYREVARTDDGAELDVPKAAALVASGFGVFVHGGGFALDREALRRSGMPEEEARRRVLGLGALEYAVLAPAALVAAAVVVGRGLPVSLSLTVPWIVGLPIGAALALTAVHFRDSVGRWPFIGEPLKHGLNAIDLVLPLVFKPGRHWLGLLGIVVYWGGDIFCLWSTLHAFSAHTPPVAQLVVGYATGYAATRRALPLGGAGIVEALLPFALGWVKIARAPALLAVFAYRIINLWLPMIPALAGIPTLRRLERTERRSRTRRRQRPARRSKPV